MRSSTRFISRSRRLKGAWKSHDTSWPRSAGPRPALLTAARRDCRVPCYFYTYDEAHSMKYR